MHADDYIKESGYPDCRANARSLWPLRGAGASDQRQTARQTDAHDARFRASAISPARDGLKIPDVDVVREFYSRFR